VVVVHAAHSSRRYGPAHVVAHHPEDRARGPAAYVTQCHIRGTAAAAVVHAAARRFSSSAPAGGSRLVAAKGDDPADQTHQSQQDTHAANESLGLAMRVVRTGDE
jgi:hypothetical protein